MLVLTRSCQVNCQPSISPGILITLYVINIVTDFYLIYIPLPMLFRSKMKMRVKVGLCFLFCCAFFIVMAATLRMALLILVCYSHLLLSMKLDPGRRGRKPWVCIRKLSDR